MRRLLVLLLLCSLPGAAEAVNRESPFKKIKNAVVGKNYSVESTSALSINVGAGFGQEYTRDLQFGLSYRYHFSPYVGIGATALFGLSFESALVGEIRDVLPASLANVRPETMLGAFTIDVHMVPIYGKFVLFGKYAVHYDLSLTLGLGIAGVQKKFLAGQNEDSGFRGSFTPSIGLGLRLLFSRRVGLNVEFRDYIWSENNPLTGVSSLSNHYSVTLGPVFVF